jgi:uncharacterized Rmd1/YagE family protein
MSEPLNNKKNPKATDTKPRGANRSTKVAGKLKVLPEQPEDLPVLPSKPFNKPPRDHAESAGTTGDSDDGDVEENDDSQEYDAEVYNQISLIPEGTARRDALKLTKKKAKSLPRVTAYATASSYRMNDLMKFFNARRTAYHTDPKLIDDVIYTPYLYDPPNTQDSRRPPGTSYTPTGDLLGIPELREDGGSDEEQAPKKRKTTKFDTTAIEAEIFLFNYGTVVVWGMTEAQERRFLTSL